jgi:hypothetical protein
MLTCTKPARDTMLTAVHKHKRQRHRAWPWATRMQREGSCLAQDQKRGTTGLARMTSGTMTSTTKAPLMMMQVYPAACSLLPTPSPSLYLPRGGTALTGMQHVSVHNVRRCPHVGLEGAL